MGLINSPWPLVFILCVFFLFLSGFNLYCWKGVHFSWSLGLNFSLFFFGLIISFHFWFRDLLREFYKKYEILLMVLCLVFFLFLASEALLFVSFFFIPGFLTPLHIVPEWYFLCQYAMLKAAPNKNSGFIILLTSIFALFFFGEIRNLTTFTRLMDCNNGFSLSFFFSLFLSFLWIGAQFPQEKFLSYARILALDYYFLLMCIF